MSKSKAGLILFALLFAFLVPVVIGGAKVAGALYYVVVFTAASWVFYRGWEPEIREAMDHYGLFPTAKISDIDADVVDISKGGKHGHEDSADSA